MIRVFILFSSPYPNIIVVILNKRRLVMNNNYRRQQKHTLSGYISIISRVVVYGFCHHTVWSAIATIVTTIIVVTLIYILRSVITKLTASYVIRNVIIITQYSRTGGGGDFMDLYPKTVRGESLKRKYRQIHIERIQNI